MSVEKIINLYIEKLVASLLSTASSAMVFIQKNCNFTLAFLITVVFYLPALNRGSINAGFLYTGDVLGWYLPALAKTQDLLHSFNFTAIDFSTFNGSSDFFLSPNFFSSHPLVVIYSLLASPETSSFQKLGQFFVILMAESLKV